MPVPMRSPPPRPPWGCGMTIAASLADCPACGTLQRRPDTPEPGALVCAACKTVLERTGGRSLDAALACSASALLLLVPANLAWFLSTSVAGVSRTSWLASSAVAMLQDGWAALALLIFLFVVVFPFMRFGLLTWVLGSLRLGRRPRGLGRAFRWAHSLQTWAMPDVFLLGLLVAFARLKASIAVQMGLGAYAFIAVGVLALLTRACLDKSAVWRLIAPDAEPPPSGDWLTCTGCELALPPRHEGCACPRCGAAVHARKPEAVGRAGAMTLAALLLYLPANLYPLATLPIGVTPTKYTVLEGVIDLTQAHLLGLALLVFCASFAIPFLKLAGIGWCLSSVLRRSPRRLRMKTRLYQIVEEIGRWSMVDPFVIACFVPVMQYNSLIYGRAEPAATPFAAVVVLTMLATRAFDPRLMWDAARARPLQAARA
jgi:paraquat-inducible protein A